MRPRSMKKLRPTLIRRSHDQSMSYQDEAAEDVMPQAEVVARAAAVIACAEVQIDTTPSADVKTAIAILLHQYNLLRGSNTAIASPRAKILQGITHLWGQYKPYLENPDNGEDIEAYAGRITANSKGLARHNIIWDVFAAQDKVDGSRGDKRFSPVMQALEAMYVFERDAAVEDALLLEMAAESEQRPAYD